jgi:hypothetical protein
VDPHVLAVELVLVGLLAGAWFDLGLHLRTPPSGEQHHSLYDPGVQPSITTSKGLLYNNKLVVSTSEVIYGTFTTTRCLCAGDIA